MIGSAAAWQSTLEDIGSGAHACGDGSGGEVVPVEPVVVASLGVFFLVGVAFVGVGEPVPDFGDEVGFLLVGESAESIAHDLRVAACSLTWRLPLDCLFFLILGAVLR